MKALSTTLEDFVFFHFLSRRDSLNQCRNILLHLGQNVTKAEIPKGSPLWQGVQGDRVPLLKLWIVFMKGVDIT